MRYPKLGTKIVLDEDKIIKDGIYDLDKIYDYMDKLAQEYNLTKIDKYTFLTQGNNMDMANLCLFCEIENYDWFIDNLKEWLWLEDNGNYVVDIIKRHNLKKSYTSEK